MYPLKKLFAKIIIETALARGPGRVGSTNIKNTRHMTCKKCLSEIILKQVENK